MLYWMQARDQAARPGAWGEHCLDQQLDGMGEPVERMFEAGSPGTGLRAPKAGAPELPGRG